MDLLTPVGALHRVGKTLDTRLKHLGIRTVSDLLFYFPFRYEDYSRIVPIAELREGEQVTIRADIELVANKRSPRKRTMVTEAVVSDDSGRLRLVWFHQPFIAKVLHMGDRVFFSGKVKPDPLGNLTLQSPVYEKEKKEGTTHTARIVPVYALTYGITQKQMRFLLSQCLPLAKEIPDWLPDDTRRSAGVVPLSEALRMIHFPDTKAERSSAERRLKFDELFLLQLRAEMLRQSAAGSTAPAIRFHEAETKAFVGSLPFVLTSDQKIAAWEILLDIAKNRPMNRLLEGDVGSGKTVVAGIAAYNAALSGHQSAIMAPTEVLALQHYHTLSRLFAETGMKVALCTRSYRKISDEKGDPSKKEFFKMLNTGNRAIVIGTHALLQEAVAFRNLGLIVVDEQHRFGVEQRKLIKEKTASRETPHFLSMTATPIPRSLALVLYGDLEISFIRTLPAGRQKILTRVVWPHERGKAYQFIRSQVKEGRQAFVVCPLIEDSGAAEEKKSVLSEYKKLSEQVFPDLRVGYLHGKLKAKEKEEVMKKFSAGEIHILVSTSVIEVGVDMPNASVMMIEDADRFGLAQLHQFRGRVGRSSHQSYCFVFTASDSTRTRERLEFFAKNSDGFALAEYDLHDRGPGEVYGTEQSGMQELRLATLRDAELLKLARELARHIDFGSHPALKEKVSSWERQVHLE